MLAGRWVSKKWGVVVRFCCFVRLGEPPLLDVWLWVGVVCTWVACLGVAESVCCYHVAWVVAV